jgi:glyoxalase family protein
MATSAGLHHITAIAGDARRNLAFYSGVLGLRLIKKTVNFDDPGTYHLYFGDAAGTPGSVLTFFPWAHAARGRPGNGEAVETAFLIRPASLSFWLDRFLARQVEHDAPVKRFGETVVPFRDPDGTRLALVAREPANTLPRAAWTTDDVPADHAILGFAGVTLQVADARPSAAILTEVFGFTAAAEAGDRLRLAGGDGSTVDLLVAKDGMRGSAGAGTVHHVAFRAADDAAQAELAAALRQRGLRVTEQLDRNYFRSVYFREPSGVLYEIATDAPGFAVDEPAEQLGSKLMLPPWLEASRRDVEAALPSLT